MALSRCRQCNATLKADEVDCYACGSPVFQEDNQKVVFARRFTSVANFLFFAFLGLSAISFLGVIGLSMVSEFVPGFVTCLTSTIVMLLVRSSAQQMLEKNSRQ